MPKTLLFDSAHYDCYTKHVRQSIASGSAKPVIKSADFFDNIYPGQTQHDLLVDDSGIFHGNALQPSR